MHMHCEIVIPPTEDVEGAVETVMKPFREEEEDACHPFWDWYVIGGRFAGNKRMGRYDKDILDAFHQWLQDEKVTVSGLQCGKQELQPASQIPKVDAKWNEMFPPPDGKRLPCPLFAHSNDQYGHDGKGTLPDDICTLADTPGITCARVIIAGPGYNSDTDDYTGPPKAVYMVCEDQWNGVIHMKIDWDRTIKSALTGHAKHIESYKEQYREKMTPQDDWLTVTVDYHS